MALPNAVLIWQSPSYNCSAATINDHQHPHLFWRWLHSHRGQVKNPAGQKHSQCCHPMCACVCTRMCVCVQESERGAGERCWWLMPVILNWWVADHVGPQITVHLALVRIFFFSVMYKPSAGSCFVLYLLKYTQAFTEWIIIIIIIRFSTCEVQKLWHIWLVLSYFCLFFVF